MNDLCYPLCPIERHAHRSLVIVRSRTVNLPAVWHSRMAALSDHSDSYSSRGQRLGHNTPSGAGEIVCLLDHWNACAERSAQLHCPCSTDRRESPCETFASEPFRPVGSPAPISNRFSIDSFRTCRDIYIAPACNWWAPISRVGFQNKVAKHCFANILVVRHDCCVNWSWTEYRQTSRENRETFQRKQCRSSCCANSRPISSD